MGCGGGVVEEARGHTHPTTPLQYPLLLILCFHTSPHLQTRRRTRGRRRSHGPRPPPPHPCPCPPRPCLPPRRRWSPPHCRPWAPPRRRRRGGPTRAPARRKWGGGQGSARLMRRGARGMPTTPAALEAGPSKAPPLPRPTAHSTSTARSTSTSTHRLLREAQARQPLHVHVVREQACAGGWHVSGTMAQRETVTDIHSPRLAGQAAQCKSTSGRRQAGRSTQQEGAGPAAWLAGWRRRAASRSAAGQERPGCTTGRARLPHRWASWSP